MTHHDDEPAFLDDEGPSNDLPAFISTTNARELYGLREGETVAEAITRHQDEMAESAAWARAELARRRKEHK